jgi:hypothetical protein
MRARDFWPLMFAALLAGCGSAATSDGSPLDLPVSVAGQVSYVLEDGEVAHLASPATFEIPPLMTRHDLKPGQFVKLMFTIKTATITQTERMWVVVSRREGDHYVGVLDNDPVTTTALRHGMDVRFEPRHVVQILVRKSALPNDPGP